MASGSVVKFRPSIGFATETLAVGVSVQVLTPSVYKGSTNNPGGAETAFITNYGNSIRYFYDSTTPDASTGHVLPDGGILTLSGQNQISQFKCIRLASDSTITITYEKE